MIKKITDCGNVFIRIVTGLLAVVFALYGILMLWDMFRTEMKAFATYDLMKYRPNIEEDEPPYLDDLLKINKDTAAWITIYNTNIDYPVMQGKDDMEYLNKDVYGEFTISGSIFMASQNSKDFSDPYNLLYGHHMENGSMFGDVLKFKDKDFFDKNDIGVLILDEKVYDLKIMACLETDAYDHEIYWVGKDEADSFVDYAKSKATFFRDAEYEKILALSTCDDAVTSGRTVLVCAMTTRTAPLPDREYGKPIPHRQAVGHPMAGAYWALLNLFILLATIYYAIRIFLARKHSKLTNIANILLCLAAIILFVITENPHKPIQVVDGWTPVMLIILILIWVMAKREAKKPLQEKEEKLQ